MNFRNWIFILFVLGLLACKSNTQNISNKNPLVSKSEYIIDSKFPKPIGYVNDFEDIFTIEERIQLEKMISEYEKETTREIAIVTIDSIIPYKSIKDYTTDLSNEWGIGKFDKDNGLTILFSKNLREIWIGTGTGTEKILTDDVCKMVLDKSIIPEFKKGNYYDGVQKGLLELMKYWN